MRAAVFTEPFTLDVREVDTPEPGPGEVLIRVLATTLCGSDLHAFQGQHPLVQPVTWFGHEIGGEVVEVGDGVTGLQTGQRAAVDGVLPCGNCSVCAQDRGNLCLSYRIAGVRQDGALAEYVVVPAANVHPVPDSISAEQAALVQPLSIAYRAVRRRAGVREGDTVVLIGAGPVGLAALVHAKAAGARVLSMDLRSARLETARRFGADATVDVRDGDPLEAVDEFTDGLGANHTIECAGGEQDTTLQLACRTTGRGGQMTLLGSFSGETFSVLSHEFRWKELTLAASHSYTADEYRDCAQSVISGEIDVADFITHRFALDEAQAALEALDAGDESMVKAVVLPQEVA